MVNEDRMLSFESKFMELNSRVLELETIGAAVSKQLDSLGHETDSENGDDELVPEHQPKTKLGKAMLAKVQRSVSPGSRKSDDKTVKLPDINKKRGVNSRSPSPKQKKFVPVDMTEHPNLACINYCDYKVDEIFKTISSNTKRVDSLEAIIHQGAKKTTMLEALQRKAARINAEKEAEAKKGGNKTEVEKL